MHTNDSTQMPAHTRLVMALASCREALRVHIESGYKNEIEADTIKAGLDDALSAFAFGDALTNNTPQSEAALSIYLGVLDGEITRNESGYVETAFMTLTGMSLFKTGTTESQRAYRNKTSFEAAARAVVACNNGDKLAVLDHIRNTLHQQISDTHPPSCDSPIDNELAAQVKAIGN